MSDKAIFIANKFKLIKKIGEGSFGKTFIASYRTRIKNRSLSYNQTKMMTMMTMMTITVTGMKIKEKRDL
jgi:hypothetical protein